MMNTSGQSLLQGPLRLVGESVLFPAEVRPALIDRWSEILWAVRESKPTKLVLDFSVVTKAFPNSMLPVLAGVTWLRREGIVCTFIPPRAPESLRLFERTNWAHFLSPAAFRRSDSASDRHLAVFQYSDSAEQFVVVREIVDRVLRTATIEQSALNALDWSISELTDNVQLHAECPEGGFVQLEVMKDRLAFCIADCGIGMFKSLKPTFPTLRDDLEAIQHAVRAGVTRNRDIGQGNGLSGSLALAIAFEGQCSIKSWQGSVLWQPNRPLRAVQNATAFPGTVIDLQMRTDMVVDLGPVIAGEPGTAYQPRDVVEDFHLNDDLRTYSVKLQTETFGFGTRSAGKQMRTKVLNILRAAAEAPLILDWDGIAVIASSFADEFLGKLFVELGPIRFMHRIRIVNATPLVSALLDKAIRQRVQQSMEGNG